MYFLFGILLIDLTLFISFVREKKKEQNKNTKMNVSRIVFIFVHIFYRIYCIYTLFLLLFFINETMKRAKNSTIINAKKQKLYNRLEWNKFSYFSLISNVTLNFHFAFELNSLAPI